LPAASPADQRLLAFQLGGRSFALPAELVREVARLPRISHVPNAPKALLGLANVRGAVVPVLSLSALMHGKAVTAARVIVVDVGEPVGLAVDAVAEVISGAQASAEGASRIDVPALIAGAIRVRAERRAYGGHIAASELQDVGAERVALVTFSVAGQTFALPVSAVKEIVRIPDEIASLPHADDVVIGSTLLRGEILPLLSLHALLALPGRARSARARVLVAIIGTHRVGLLVDAVREILHVEETDIDPMPHVLTRGTAEARIQAICRIHGASRLVSILAADQLLRDDITMRLLQGGAGDEDEMTQDDGTQVSEQFLLFRIGTAEFGLPIAAVAEVAALPLRLTALPRAPAFVKGVMNLRGQVIPVIDQGQRFGSLAASGAKSRVVVVKVGDLLVGFVVDAVSEVQRIPIGALRDAPELGGDETRVFERVANLTEQQKIVLIISPRELLDRAERDLLESFTRTDVTARQ